MAQAFAWSLSFHILVFGVIEIGNIAGWWAVTGHRSLLNPTIARAQSAPAKAAGRAQPARDQEPPVLFVDVSPSQAAAEPPKTSSYYSYLNSVAANPNPKSDSKTPRIDGTQTKIVKTTDQARPTPLIPQPDTPPQQAARKAQPVAPPQPKPIAPAKPVETAKNTSPSNVKPGNTQMTEPQAKSSSQPATSAQSPASSSPNEPPSRVRPRTLADARQLYSGLAGEKVKQEGGVKRYAIESSLDVRKQPFGQYDALFIAAVQKRWFDLLEERDYVQGRSGKVVLRFNLYYDGRITNLEVSESSVGELLAIICQRAVLDPAPYAPWPTDLRRLAKSNFREVQFTFFYN